VASHKDLKPGDLVIEFSRHNDREHSHFALVIGVDYPREGHLGCEERVKVMFSQPIIFETLCDCSLVLVDTFLVPSTDGCSLEQGHEAEDT